MLDTVGAKARLLFETAYCVCMSPYEQNYPDTGGPWDREWTTGVDSVISTPALAAWLAARDMEEECFVGEDISLRDFFVALRGDPTDALWYTVQELMGNCADYGAGAVQRVDPKRNFRFFFPPEIEKALLSERGQRPELCDFMHRVQKHFIRLDSSSEHRKKAQKDHGEWKLNRPRVA